MSADNNAAAASDMETSCCASCGVAESDDVKLKKCNGCYLVRYCGIKCQRDHWRQHKKECKKRAAELHEELLFKSDYPFKASMLVDMEKKLMTEHEHIFFEFIKLGKKKALHIF